LSSKSKNDQASNGQLGLARSTHRATNSDNSACFLDISSIVLSCDLTNGSIFIVLFHLHHEAGFKLFI
jgi:hypothetical protein